MGDFDFKTTSFKVSGFSDIYKALDGLSAIQKSIGLSPLLERALQPMGELAASIAPDDPTTPPPRDLKSSISVSTKQRTGRAKFDRPLGQYAARAYMGPSKNGYPQALFQEFGTSKMLPSPYMRPSYDTMKHRSLEIIKEGWAKQVNYTAKLFKVTPRG